MNKEELFLRNLITIQLKKQKLVIFGSNQKKKKLLSTTEDENESRGKVLPRFDNKKLDLPMIMNWPVTSKRIQYVARMKKHTPVVNQIFITNYN